MNGEDASNPYGVNLPKEGVYWARMTGYSPWPGRFCSAPEADRILHLRKKNQVPIYFLASRQIAWVGISGIERFTADSTVQRLDKNKLRAHKPYRHAVVEAMRVAIAAGESFPEAVNVVINSYEECAQSLAREDVCSICRGSELSGDALLCDNCNVAETHLHCLTPQIIDPPEGNWYCGDCCELKHLPRHYMPPQVIVQAEEEPPPEPSPDPVGHASSRKSKHAPSLASAPVDEISSGKRSKRVGGSESASFRREGASVLESLQRLVATVAPTDASDSDGDLQDVQATPYTSVLGKTKGVYNGTIRPSIGSYISDICAVCELGGTLMLCDYPGCRRSFHHTCIPKKTIFNASKAFGDSVMGRAGEDEPWICPSHFCVLCKALSTGNGMQELSDLSIPSYLKLNGDHIQRKPLSSCLKCPMSICLDCERDLGSGIPVILLGERAQSGEAGVSASCGVIPVNLAKLSDNYDPTADVFAIYPIENETSSSFNPFKTFSSKQQGELVISALVNRIELPTIIRGTDGNSGSAEDEGLLLLGGRTARRRGVVNYSDNTPKKMPGQKSNVDLIPICLNCCSTDCELLLAKSLEKMMSTVCNSRLCLPFLRPLLPFCDRPKHNSTMRISEDCNKCGASGTKVSSDFELSTPVIDLALNNSELLPCFGGNGNTTTDDHTKIKNMNSEKPPDLVGIFEKIRRLEYASAGQLLSDMENIRELVLVRIQEGTFCRGSIIAAQCKEIIWAFDYLIEIAIRYDNAHLTSHKKIQASIAEKNQKVNNGKDAERNRESHGSDNARNTVTAKRLHEYSEHSPEMKRARHNNVVACGRNKAHNGIAGFEAVITIAGILAVQREFQSKWRLECETPIKSALKRNNYMIDLKRSICDWCEYLKKGQMPACGIRTTLTAEIGSSSSSYADVLTEFCEPNITDNSDDVAPSEKFPIFERGKISWLRSMGIEDLASEVEAAQIMNGFRHSNLRENVSLQHAIDHNSGPIVPELDPMFFDPMGTLDSTNLANDDNLIILEQLREMSRRTMGLSAQLQQRIRKQHLDDLARSSTNVTIGEGKLISELKVANDNLRWRLQQKNRTIDALEVITKSLTSVTEELQQTISDKNELILKYRNEIERIHGNVVSGNGSTDNLQKLTDFSRITNLEVIAATASGNRPGSLRKSYLKSSGPVDSLLSMTNDFLNR